jgi:sodium transport system permease protein
MNIAMDSLAGERERRSLLPLLMNPVRRRDLVLSKWIAISASACLGVLANVCGLAIVFAHAGLLTKVAAGSMIEILAIGIVPLALFAAVAELFVSTLSRTLREAHTSIAFVVFLPMVLGMFLVFFPHVFGKWTLIVPILGQELLLGVSAHGGHLDVKAAWILCGLTLWLALICLRLTERLLGRDAIVYGN